MNSAPRVVFVDDERPVLASLERLLRGEPYTVLTTDRPGEALRWVETQDVGVLITDYRMPEMNGIEFLEKVRERSPRTARILLTGHPGETIVSRGLKMGRFWILSKPWDNDQIRRIIRERVQDPSRDGGPKDPASANLG